MYSPFVPQGQEVTEQNGVFISDLDSAIGDFQG